MAYNSFDSEVYDILSPLTTALTRIQVYRKETIDRLMEFVSDFCGKDEDGRKLEACLHQFIVQARKLEDNDYEAWLADRAERLAVRG